MELYIIRHGESETNKLGLHCGWGDVPLTDLGHEQARRSGKLINHINFDIVYVSDLKRAKQTAEDALPGYSYQFTDKLREISVGKLSQQSPEACLEKYGQLYIDAKTKHDFSAFEGESAEEMMKRITSFMHDLESIDGKHNIAVVAHEGTAHCILCYVLGHSIPTRLTKLDNASVSKFSYQKGIWKLNTWNFTGTL
ncbi:MAG: histidine phosphatase family protein [Clostridiaceae bacterium]|jgi:broad specificity phosphatase PhoE|nr:histidine phosphatase family protein [Clostridiaceae bacterium]